MRRLFMLLLVAILCLGAAACGSNVNVAASGSPPAGQATGTTVVKWSDAPSHIGEVATVEGPVIGATYAESSNGSPTFLNVGADYPDPSRFTVVVWGEDRGNFPVAPEDKYAGKTIRVTGTIYDYQGVPQVEVTSPGDIKTVRPRKRRQTLVASFSGIGGTRIIGTSSSRPVTDYFGDSDIRKMTSVFRLTGQPVRLHWSIRPAGMPSSFLPFVGVYFVDGSMSRFNDRYGKAGRPDMDTDYFHSSTEDVPLDLWPGSYRLVVEAFNCRWSLSVYEQVTAQ